jgi:hypothetical protein
MLHDGGHGVNVGLLAHHAVLMQTVFRQTGLQKWKRSKQEQKEQKEKKGKKKKRRKSLLLNSPHSLLPSSAPRTDQCTRS